MRRVCLKPIRNFLLLLFLLHLGGALSVFAETLEKYRADVERVRGDLTYLYSISPEDYDDDWSEKDQLKAESDFFNDLAAYMPPRENVEWNGITVDIDNRWLHQRLEEIRNRRKSGTFVAKDHDAIVTELDARLASLEAKFLELEKLPESARSKDAEKQKLDEILKRAEYKPPEVKDKSALERWYQALGDWFAGLFPKPQPVDPNVQPIAIPTIPAGLVQLLVVLLVLAVLGFVLWRFLPIFRDRRLKRKEKKTKRERVILGEKLAEDESAVTLFGQAEQMARDGNFRGAIRKGYIAMLCELGDRKIVRLAQHKTNHDYLRDLKKDLELHGDVRDLTFLFENHWYGLAAATEEEWGNFRDHYRRSTAKLG
jgi:hypothetical protein